MSKAELRKVPTRSSKNKTSQQKGKEFYCYSAFKISYTDHMRDEVCIKTNSSLCY